MEIRGWTIHANQANQSTAQQHAATARSGRWSCRLAASSVLALCWLLALAPLAAFVIMTYDIQEQLAQPDGEATCHLDAPAPQGTGARFVGNLTGQIRLHNIGHEITALGQLRAVAVLACCRCLREHEVPLEFDFCETCSLTQIDEPGLVVEKEYPEYPIDRS